jgi:hypothetical protein
MKFETVTFLTTVTLFCALPIPVGLAALNANSEIIPFDAPGVISIAASGYGTFPESINDAGVITGHYTDAQALIHGFVRSPSGKFATFDAPGPTGGAGWGIFPESINDAGAITAHYTDAVGMNHGFLRLP